MAGTNRILPAYKDTTMSTEPFTDEILSAIIDGEADEGTIASVAADAAATARLEQLRTAVRHVATPVPEASPERRRASIAAAMAEATAAPQVASLAAARHERTTQAPWRAPQRGRWLAAVAAAILLVVAVPLLANLRGGDDAVDTASDEMSSSLDSGDTATNDSASDTDDTADSAADDGAVSGETGADAMADEGVEGVVGSTADDAMDSADDAEDDTDADEPAFEEPAEDASPVPQQRLASAPTVDSVANVNEFISLGAIAPQLTLDQVVDAGVSAECADSLSSDVAFDEPVFDIAFLDENGTDSPRLLLIQFNDDETTTTLDAKDCSRLG